MEGSYPIEEEGRAGAGEKEGGASVEVCGDSVGEAKWAAMKELEQRYPGIGVEQVEFEVVGEAAAEECGRATVRATADVGAWRARVERFEWPEEPAERLREMVKRIGAHLGLRVSVDVVEETEMLSALVSGGDVAVLIGKRGQTIDAVQLVCGRAVYRGQEQRKRVLVDAAGYRERRAGIVRRQAERAVADAVRGGRAVELEAMGAHERKVVHLHLEKRPEVETHSEGDEPFRRVVLTPVGPGAVPGH